MCDQAMPVFSPFSAVPASASSTLPSLQVPLLGRPASSMNASPHPKTTVLSSDPALSLTALSSSPREAVDSQGIGGEISLNSSIAEISSDESEDEDSDSSSSRNGTGDRKTTDAANYRELVHFLQTLESVPYDRLPCAAVPPTMVGAELRPFQLQALHWLQHQESPIPLPNCLSDRYSDPRRARFGSPGGVYSPNYASTALGDRALSRGASSPLNPAEEATWQAAKSVRGGIFADYMGLGKTRTMIALCEATRRPHVDRITGSQVESVATLVVCPSALLHVWLSELHRCVGPAPSVMLYHGTNRRRHLSLFELAQKYDYVLTSYQTLRHESSSKSAPPGRLYMIHWQRIVLDEAHVIRSLRAQQTRACLRLSGVCKWVITATPVYNSLNDLFPLLKFLGVPYFGEQLWWNEEIVRHFNMDINHPRPTTALRILFSSLLLRRTPDSIVGGYRILELPPKHIKTELVDVSKEEKKFYDTIYANANRKLDIASKRQAMGSTGSGNQLTTFNTAFEMIIRCRQALLHPYIVVAALRHCSKLGNNTNQASKGSEGADSSARKTRDDNDKISHAIQHYIDTVLRNRVVVKDSTFFQELVEELKRHELDKRECIICFDRVNRPAILPCGHTFCSECIEHALQLNRTCPMCKRPTKNSQISLVPLEFISNNSAGDCPHKTSVAGSLFDSLEGVDLGDHTNWPISLSTKTQWLINALGRIPLGEKAIVFSTFVTYLRYLQHCLNKKGISNILYTGELTFRDKDKVLKCFSGENSPPHARGNQKDLTENKSQSRSRGVIGGSPRVLLTTFSSSSVGLNLTCANHCFMMEPLWSPGLEEQALHRVHRIGQTRPVTMTKLLARGTVEEKIERLCQQKRALSGYCFQPGSEERSGTASVAAQGWDVHRLRTEDLLTLFANDQKRDADETESSSSDDSSSS
ncbi:unnamed protein product [Phytomonas sp. Hart1]|nr:unnamed protein product [Phytomonas sp. Hart1]|eukprot:CCW68648.1 unnamed protein product [Phytomonas sp. isolate Hart1]